MKLTAFLNEIGNCIQVKEILIENILFEITEKLSKLDLQLKYLTEVQSFQIIWLNKENNITFL